MTKHQPPVTTRTRSFWSLVIGVWSFRPSRFGHWSLGFGHSPRGFTLIELLIVIAIIGILAAVVILAVNPGRQIAQANNAQRQSDVNAVLNAVHQYAVDNDGNLPTGMDATNRVLGTCAAGATCTAVAVAGACLNLSSALTPRYLSAIPADPRTGSAADTDYYVATSAENRVTVGACAPELGATIAVTR